MLVSIAKTISEQIQNAIYSKGAASIAVCAGRSPLGIFKKISNSDLNWKAVTVTLIDDRLVHENHPDSNQTTLRNHLFKNAALKANFVSLQSFRKDYSLLSLPFDLVIVAPGDDGHIASLFPSMINSALIIERRAFDLKAKPEIIEVLAQGKPKLPRLSMNLSMLIQTKRLFLFISNKSKARIMHDAESNSALPLHYLMKQDQVLVEILHGFKPATT